MPTHTKQRGAIKWNASQEITTPTFDPLVSGTAKTSSWKITVGTTAEYQAETPITGLQPSTQYCYAIYSSHTSTAQEMWPVQTFTTLAQPGTAASLTFDVIGDTGENTVVNNVPYPNFVNPGEEAVYQGIGNSGAQFLLEAGDISYTGGTELSYGDLNQVGTTGSPDVSDIFGPNYEPLAKGIPSFVADGNHGQTSDDLRIWPEPNTVAASNGVYSYGPAPAQVDGISNQSPSDWYAIQDGQTRIYVLDASWAGTADGSATGAECASQFAHCVGYQADGDEHWQTNSTEYQWLKADLAAHPGGVKMAVFHYPLASVNESEAADPYLSNLESLLAEGGVQVAFNGHAHSYQDIRPTAPGTVANFVTGGGGGVLEPVDTTGDRNPTSELCNPELAQATVYALGWDPAAAAAGKQGGSECSTGNVAPTPTSAMQVFNFLKVTVNGTQVTVTAINALNQPFDSATFNYGAAPDTQKPTVPTGLTTTSVTPNAVGLSWTASTDNVGVTGYDVLRDGAQIGTTTTASFTDSTAAPSTAYHYTVEAFDAAGNTSDPSTPLLVTTPASPPPPPPGISFVQSAGSTTKTVTVSSPARAGDLLVLSASLYTGATARITAISDGSDTWRALTDAYVAGHNSDGEMWFTVARGGETAVTVSTAAANVALGVQEFSGLGTAPGVDVGSGSDTSTSASAGASGTGLAVGFVAGHANAEVVTGPPGFVNQVQQTTPTPFASLVDGYDLSALGNVAYSGTFGTAMYWSAGIVVFTPSS